MEELLKLLDAAEAAYELNPCDRTEKWIEDIWDKIIQEKSPGNFPGNMGNNKPLKTPINPNRISKKHTLKMAIKKALKPLF